MRVWHVDGLSAVLDALELDGPADCPEWGRGLAAARRVVLRSGLYNRDDLVDVGAALCRARAASIGRASIPYVVLWAVFLQGLGVDLPGGPAALLKGGSYASLP